MGTDTSRLEVLSFYYLYITMWLFTTEKVTNTQTVVPVVQTIHEHKAPTDESVKILKEMREKTISSIIEQSCGNNILEWFAFQIEDDVNTDSKNIYWWFKINWELYEFSAKSDSIFSKDDLFKKLMEEISNCIFMEVQKKILNSSVIAKSYH